MTKDTRTPEQIERARLAADAAERRILAQRERGMRRLREERLREERERRAQFLQSHACTPSAIFNLIGPANKWREHVDGRHHQWGKDVYVRGLHRQHQIGGEEGNVADPQYNDYMMKADRLVYKMLGRPLTASDYGKIHDATGSKEAYGSNLRNKPINLRFDRFCSTITELEAEGDPYVEYSARPCGQSARKFIVTCKFTKDPGGEVDSILKEYYAKLPRCREGNTIELIALTHKRLENLHPYVDRNTRTNRLVLNKLLADELQPLAMLYSPLDVHHSTLPVWVQSIRDAQNAWTDFVLNNIDPTVVEAEWKAFHEGEKRKEEEAAILRKWGY